MSVHSLRNSVHNSFATKHLFRDCFARNFEYSLIQREWDTLAVREVLWATIMPPTRGTQQRFVNTQTNMLPVYPCALFGRNRRTENIRSAILFSSVGKNGISRRHVEVESFSSSISLCKYIVLSFILCFWNRYLPMEFDFAFADVFHCHNLITTYK